MPSFRNPCRRALLPLLLLAAGPLRAGGGLAWAVEPAALAEKLEAAARSGKRPIVGLALSGGGARGFAHIGVLKALEELHIPVDRVAGTSMGSVVGGLFACGYSPAKIEQAVLRVDWGDILRNAAPRSMLALFERQESGRYLVSLPMERLRVRIPAGLTEGDKVTNLLALLTVSAVGAESFDDLPIPFRAVTTDLVTGERVALNSGSLPEAIRASLAFPLFFTPVELDGRLLADGGLSDNLPVDVAREMGSEIILASDVTSPLRGRTDLETPLGVGDQAISLQIVASARKMRAQADAAVLPALEKVTPADFHRIPEIIQAGYDAAMNSPELKRIAAALAPLSGEPRQRKPAPVLGGMRVVGTERYGGRELDKMKAEIAGKALSAPDLPDMVSRVLGRRYFRKVRFALEPGPDGAPELVVQVSEQEGDELNFSARGDDKYGPLGLVNLSFRDLGGGDNLASFDFQVGSFSRAAVEFVRPSVPGTSFFFRPQAFWSNDFQLAYPSAGGTSRFVDRRWGGEVPVGNTFRNLGAVTLGYRFVSYDFHADEGAPILPSFQGQIASLVLRSHVDTLDRAGIPDAGRLVDFSFEAARPRLGGDVDFDRARLEYSGYQTWGDRHTLTSGLRLGTSFAGSLPVFEQYRLGGEEYLLGLRREELRGNHVAGVRAGYRLRLGGSGNSFASRFYLEAGVDAANAWVDRDSLGGGFLVDGYVSFLARTWVGPLRVNLGATEGGRRNATFSLGHAF